MAVGLDDAAYLVISALMDSAMKGGQSQSQFGQYKPNALFGEMLGQQGQSISADPFNQGFGVSNIFGGTSQAGDPIGTLSTSMAGGPTGQNSGVDSVATSGSMFEDLSNRKTMQGLTDSALASRASQGGAGGAGGEGSGGSKGLPSAGQLGVSALLNAPPLQVNNPIDFGPEMPRMRMTSPWDAGQMSSLDPQILAMMSQYFK